MGPSIYAMVAEITSARAISQQGLTATCKDPHHRVSHRHPRRRGTGSARRAGTTASPTRPGGGPHPASQSHRPAQLAVPFFPGEQCLARIIMAATDLIAWAKLIGFTDDPGLARCEVETFRYGSCTSLPASLAALDNHGCASMPPGAGHTPSPPPGAGSAPRSLIGKIPKVSRAGRRHPAELVKPG
jgi:hypothetical protein